MIASELRRCPFCGNEYCMMHDHGMIRLTAAIEEYCCTIQYAVAEWNTRKMWDEKKKRIQDIYDDGGTYDDLHALQEIVNIVMNEDYNS